MPMMVAVKTRIERVLGVERLSRMRPMKGIEMMPPRGRDMSKMLFTCVARSADLRRYSYCGLMVATK